MQAKELSWDEYFIKITETVALRSKDPSTKLGCVIADQRNRVVSLGYNGMIQGADETKMTLSERPMKYYFAIHAEMNAILFAHQDLTGCTLYSLIASCENCLKYCLQAGLKRFVYKELRVHSYANRQQKTMTNVETDEAVIRLLTSMPDVKTLNITNGKTYIQDILDSYEKDSEEYKRLAKWI